MSSQPYLGQLMLFAGNFAPVGWALCNGQLLPIAQNQALFSLLGTIYGGDGRTTFALPDLRGRVPIHFGQGPGLSNRPIGQRSGQEQVTLSILEMPSHNHTATVGGGGSGSAIQQSADAAVNETPATGDVHAIVNFRNGLSTQNVKSFGPANNLVDGQTISGGSSTVTIQNTGGSQPHNNMQPYQVINYCIALVGIYPSRS